MSAHRSSRLVVVLVAVLAVATSCSSSDDDESSAPTSIEDRLDELSGAGVFVGGVAMTGNLVAIHFDRTDQDAVGMKVFVTDGLPDGNAEWFEGNADRRDVHSSRPTSGKATIEGTIEDVRDRRHRHPGRRHTRATSSPGPPATARASSRSPSAPTAPGTGKSLDGSTFDRQADGPLRRGQRGRRPTASKYDFRHNDLTRRLGYSIAGRRARHLHRGRHPPGDRDPGPGRRRRRAASPSANIVSLDLVQEAAPTPGVYHGRVAGTTDRLNFETAAQPRRHHACCGPTSPTPSPSRRATSSGSPSRSPPPNFSMTSKMTATPPSPARSPTTGIGGEITLPDGAARRYFAAPSGQGAGHLHGRGRRPTATTPAPPSRAPSSTSTTRTAR